MLSLSFFEIRLQFGEYINAIVENKNKRTDAWLRR